MLEEFSSKVLSIFMRIARILISFFVLTKTLVKCTTGHANVDAWLALDIVRVRFSEALIVHNDQVERDDVNVMVLFVPDHGQRFHLMEFPDMSP